MNQLTLHELTGSPNSVKVRVALAYKGLDYERIPLSLDSIPGDRSKIVAASGQPRLPLLTHGQTSIFDSGAIMRYLEANFRNTKPLFSEDYAEHGKIEEWESHAKAHIGPAVGMVFGQALSPAVDSSVIVQANQLLESGTEALETQLSETPFLMGDRMTVADIVPASALYLADLDDARSDNPILSVFNEHFRLSSERPKTVDWVRRVIAHDPVMGASYRSQHA